MSSVLPSVNNGLTGKTEALPDFGANESSFEAVPPVVDPWTTDQQHNVLSGVYGSQVQGGMMQGGMRQGPTGQSIGGFGQMQQMFNGFGQNQGQGQFSENFFSGIKQKLKITSFQGKCRCLGS